MRYLIAILTTLPLIVPRPSAAQATAPVQTCAAGTLESYLAIGFACQLGGWQFDFFDYGVYSDSSANGVAARNASAADILIDPFDAIDAYGQRTFGFGFDGFSTLVSADQANTGSEWGTTLAFLQFYATAIDPVTAIARAALDLSAQSVNGTPGRLSITAGGFGSIADGTTFIPCAEAFAEVDGTGTDQVHGESACLPPLESAVVTLGLAGYLERYDFETIPVTGQATASVDGISFTVPGQVAPEPATITLLGSAMLIVGGVAARRRRLTREG